MNPDKRLKNKLDRIRKSKLSERNILFLDRFVQKCQSEGMSERRIVKYLNYLSQQALFLSKDFDNIEKEGHGTLQQDK